MPVKEMTSDEIDQFLTCARVGRLGITVNGRPYIIPLGFGYADGKIFFHTCNEGLKMDAIRRNQDVCFETDESLSDATMFKSVMMFGKAEILEQKEAMIPYLQKLIDKYRIPMGFDEYMSKPGKNREKELAAVKICVITPKSVTGRQLIP